MSWNERLKLEQFYSEQLAALQKMHKQHDQLVQQIAHMDEQIGQYEETLREERIKLEQLDRFSFMNALRELTGKKDRLMEQSLEAAAVQELKLTEAQLMREDLQDDLVDLMYRINAINEPYTKEQLALVQQEKQQWLQAHVPHVAQKLEQMLTREQQFELLKKEIREAVAAGHEAKTALRAAYDALATAKNYSTWDLVGGGFLATMLKHDKLEQSNSYAHRAQIALQRFQNELLDIEKMKTTSMTIETDGFVKFADYFFDDIFSEWSVHSKIKEAQMRLVGVMNDIDNTLSALGRKLAHVEQGQAELQEQKEKLLSTEEQALFLL